MIHAKCRLIRDDMIGFRINSGIKQAVISVASSRGLSVAEYVTKMIRKDLAEKSVEIEIPGYRK